MRLVISILFLLPLIVSSQTIVNYTYDAMGNRIKREIIMSRSIKNTNNPLTETLLEKSISIYPNPTEGLLKINISGWEITDKCNFKVYSLNGLPIQEITVVSSITEINLGNEPNGIYLLNIELNESKSSWKIIKK